MKRICLLTNDVETTSIVNGGLSDTTGELVLKQGMPRLLELYEKHQIKSTFFFTGYIAKKFPDVVKMILPFGHEVACHGLTHDHNFAFDIMNYEDQKSHLTQAKKILEDISGKEVVSFRAPALRVNEFTTQALIDSGFKYDSSVAPQRMDMFMSLGSKKKLDWFAAPRKPYQTAFNNLARKGNSSIYEVPVSSFALPYIGTFMRISPILTRVIHNLLFLETRNNIKPINFLIHPNELIDETRFVKETERRAKSFLGYLLSDLLRKRLKQKNLGMKSLHLFEKEIIFWKEKDYTFSTIKDYIELSNK